MSSHRQGSQDAAEAAGEAETLRTDLESLAGAAHVEVTEATWSTVERLVDQAMAALTQSDRDVEEAERHAKRLREEAEAARERARAAQAAAAAEARAWQQAEARHEEEAARLEAELASVARSLRGE